MQVHSRNKTTHIISYNTMNLLKCCSNRLCHEQVASTSFHDVQMQSNTRGDMYKVLLEQKCAQVINLSTEITSHCLDNSEESKK